MVHIGVGVTDAKLLKHFLEHSGIAVRTMENDRHTYPKQMRQGKQALLHYNGS